jgi:uncharacterized protein YegJ (DUF2314 family)
MRLTPFFVAIFSLAIAACQQQSAASSTSSVVVDDDSTHHGFGIRSDDPEMNAAIQKARDLFPRFDSAFSKGKVNKEESIIKVKYRDEDKAEYLWVGNLFKVDDQYWGVILDSPYVVKGLKRGDTVVIQNQDIADWIYVIDSTHYGGYTQRVILNRLTPAQKARMDSTTVWKFAD